MRLRCNLRFNLGSVCDETWVQPKVQPKSHPGSPLHVCEETRVQPNVLILSNLIIATLSESVIWTFVSMTSSVEPYPVFIQTKNKEMTNYGIRQQSTYIYELCVHMCMDIYVQMCVRV